MGLVPNNRGGFPKENRTLVFSFIALLLLSAGAFYIFQRTQAASPQELTNRLLLFILWYLDVSLILVLTFILGRNLVKLVLERRAGILGARFRTKLIVTSIVLTIVPVMFIFLIATNLLQHSIDRWFSAPVEEILSGGRDLAVELRELIEQRLEEQADLAAMELSKNLDQSRLAGLRRMMGVDLLALFSGDNLIESVADPRKIPSTVPPLQWSELETQGVRAVRWRSGLLLRAWRPIEGTQLKVVVGATLPPELLRHLERANDAHSEFQNMKQQQGTITATTILVFLSVTLLLLFATVWIGLYLTRRFTHPLLAVVAATRRVAEGDALEEVEAPASDEVAVLVDSFNAMVRRVRATEQEILASNLELGTLLATIPTGVLTINADQTRFRPNRAAARLLGHQDWQKAWRPVSDLQTSELNALRLWLTTEQASDASTALELATEGETRYLELTRRPLAGGGSVVAMDDLTELVAAQRQAAWSEAARRIAHEIKNPLTPIRLAAERIQKRSRALGGELGEVLSSSCEAIVAHVSGLQELVDSFHEYARMPDVRLRPWNLVQLIRDVASIYQEVRPGLVVRCSVPEAPLWIAVDPALMRQALVNLIDNAIEAIEGEGEIEMVARIEGDDAILEVLDDGPGLPTDDLQLLTRPFYSTKGRGSGMGLAIVERVVRDHGGSFELGERSRAGTRAVIVLHDAVVSSPIDRTG